MPYSIIQCNEVNITLLFYSNTNDIYNLSCILHWCPSIQPMSIQCQCQPTINKWLLFNNSNIVIFNKCVFILLPIILHLQSILPFILFYSLIPIIILFWYLFDDTNHRYQYQYFLMNNVNISSIFSYSILL